MKEECGTGLNVSFWASTGFTPDCLPTRYLNWAEFPRPVTKATCSPGLTVMRRVTVTAGPERVLWTFKPPPTRAPTTTSAMPALIFPFIIGCLPCLDGAYAASKQCPTIQPIVNPLPSIPCAPHTSNPSGHSATLPPRRRADIPVRSNVQWLECLGNRREHVVFRRLLRTGMSAHR